MFCFFCHLKLFTICYLLLWIINLLWNVALMPLYKIQHIKTTLNVLPRLVQKHISHFHVFGRTYDELFQNQRVCRDCDETYKERTYHYLLQCPRTMRWRESLLLHLPEERFHERSKAMIGLIFNTQASSGRTGCQMNEYAELSPTHTAFWTGQSQLLDFETLIL